MPGNERYPGASRRRPGKKKGPTKGSGGNRRQGLEGKGPTPRAENRVGHPKARAKAQNLALEYSQQEITAKHLFWVLLAQPDGLAVKLLEKINIPVSTLQDDILSAIKKIASVHGYEGSL